MKRVAIQFVQEAEKVNKAKRRQGSLEDACDWEMQEIASTNLKPDIVLWSRSRMRVFFIEPAVFGRT